MRFAASSPKRRAPKSRATPGTSPTPRASWLYEVGSDLFSCISTAWRTAEGDEQLDPGVTVRDAALNTTSFGYDAANRLADHRRLRQHHLDRVPRRGKNHR